MSNLPPKLKSYLLLIWSAGLVVWMIAGGLLLRHRSFPLFPTAVLLCLLGLARTCSRKVLRGADVNLISIPLIAAVLMLPAEVCIVLVPLALVLTDLIRRRHWCEILFNAVSTTLAVAVAGLVYTTAARLGSWGLPVGALGAAAILHLVNVSLVTGAVTRQHDMPYWMIWEQMAGTELLQHGAMFAGGILLGLLLRWDLRWGLGILMGAAVAMGWAVWRQRDASARLRTHRVGS